LRVVVKMGAREKIEVLMYEGNLDVEELLDWIRDLEKYLIMRRSMMKIR
jgi:hypothetical protein